MKLKSAHYVSFMENLSAICTDRLWKTAAESLKVQPLPTLSVSVTGEAWLNGDKRTRWQRLMRVPKETSTRWCLPKAWKFSCHGGVGRKDRKLVVRLSVKWEVEGNDKRNFWWKHKERPLDQCFVTDVEVFPLTPQQAVFVGAKYVTSDSTGLFWGTVEDVVELESCFPISRTS